MKCPRDKRSCDEMSYNVLGTHRPRDEMSRDKMSGDEKS
jgi:hypothetical protein